MRDKVTGARRWVVKIGSALLTGMAFAGGAALAGLAGTI